MGGYLPFGEVREVREGEAEGLRGEGHGFWWWSGKLLIMVVVWDDGVGWRLNDGGLRCHVFLGMHFYAAPG